MGPAVYRAQMEALRTQSGVKISSRAANDWNAAQTHGTGLDLRLVSKVLTRKPIFEFVVDPASYVARSRMQIEASTDLPHREMCSNSLAVVGGTRLSLALQHPRRPTIWSERSARLQPEDEGITER